MTKNVRNVLIVGVLTVVGFALLSTGYAISKLPEEEFLKRMTVNQLAFKDIPFTDETLSFEAVVDYLRLRESVFLNKKVEWTSERGTVTASPRDLGASSDKTELYADLLKFMDNAGPLDKIKVYFLGHTFDFPLTIDREVTKLAFADSGIEQGVADAHFGYDGGVIVAREQIGYGIDYDSLELQLVDYWLRGFALPDTALLPLRTREPDIRTTDLETLLPEAEALAARTIRFSDEYGDTWDLSFAEHMDWLIPGDVDTFDIKEDLLITYLELELVPEVEEDPTPATIIIGEDGSYSFEGSARFGRELDKLSLRVELERALTAASLTEIALPITETEPEITIPTELQAKGITGLVGYGYSSFHGSPYNRIQNVKRGMEQFNGILLEQGEEFSFTSLMGPIDAANGWLPELVIKGNETIPEYGGGLCQVSSTMFRAALYTGLPITARKSHSYAVSYYARPLGYGLDATVYDPNPDLKFVNDTPGALLIQGYTDGTDAYFVFYGTKDGRTVQMEGPYAYGHTSISEPQITYTDELAPGIRELDEYAHTGFKVDWYRTVFYPEYDDAQISGGVYVSPYAASAGGVRENIHSDYEARPAKYLEGRAVDESTGAEAE